MAPALMLNARSPAASARFARRQARRSSVAVRSAPEQSPAESTSGSGNAIATLERFAASEDAKVQATISSLDALLGPQAAPTSPIASSRASSSAAASTSAPSAAPPAAKPSPPSVSAPSTPSSSSTPARKPAGLTFGQVMGFSGLAPEVINGRAAMIGFFCAISHELGNGESLYAQLVSGGAAQALLVILGVSLASFAPALRAPLDEVFNQAPKKVTEWGPFGAFAEQVNGRAAMIGIAALLFLEGASPFAFFMN